MELSHLYQWENYKGSNDLSIHSDITQYSHRSHINGSSLAGASAYNFDKSGPQIKWIPLKALGSVKNLLTPTQLNWVLVSQLNLMQQDKAPLNHTPVKRFLKEGVAAAWASGPLAYRDPDASEEPSRLETSQLRRPSSGSGSSGVSHYHIPQQTQGESGHLQWKPGTSASYFCAGKCCLISISGHAINE